MTRDALGTNSIRGFTLVETDTNVGGQALSAGDFLFTDSSMVNILWYDSNASQSSVLVDGGALGTSAITGLELIESAHTSGGITLDAGTLLLTTGGASSIGSNNIATNSFDVVALDLSSTGSGSTAGTASIVFDGSDVGLTSAERFNSLSLETVPDVTTTVDEPTFGNLGDTATFVLGGAPVTLDADVIISNAELDGATLRIGEFGNHRLSINGVELVDGAPINVSGTDIGVIGSIINGKREFHFDSDATDALVNEFLQSITYEYDGTNPPSSSINLDWEFADGTGELANGQSTVQLVEPTLDLSSGISLNTDGGNDAYLISDAGLGAPLTATTFEILFSATDTPEETVFVSFNSGAGSSQDELAIQTFENGTLELDFGSVPLVFANQIDYAGVLLDGERHSLAVTWDSASGDWEIYIDGLLRESGSNLNQNEQLDTTNGRFVFGQDQDGLDTGFQNNQRLDGTIYDVRIWDGVRSATEIAENYQQKLDPNDLPNGLIANWQFDGFDNNGQVVEVVSGNNLSVQHAPQTSTSGEYFASNPVDALNVNENSSNGTSVGFVIATSNGDTSGNTFSLSNDAGGRFAIDSATGEITVANQALLNHEVNQSHVVTVAVNDGAGNDYGEDFTITVNNVNEAPTFEMAVTPTFASNSFTANAGGATSVVTADLNGDGYLDLVSANFTDDTLTWYEKRRQWQFYYCAHSAPYYRRC